MDCVTGGPAARGGIPPNGRQDGRAETATRSNIRRRRQRGRVEAAAGGGKRPGPRRGEGNQTTDQAPRSQYHTKPIVAKNAWHMDARTAITMRAQTPFAKAASDHVHSGMRHHKRLRLRLWFRCVDVGQISRLNDNTTT